MPAAGIKISAARSTCKPLCSRPTQQVVGRPITGFSGPRQVVAQARREGHGGFWTGFALGGAICGAAGFFFAPQISRAILNEQQKFKVPAWFEQDKPPVTKAELEEKIDELHAAISDVADSIGVDSSNPKSSNGTKGIDVHEQTAV